MHRLEYKAYRRSFSREWSTSRKVWSKREGIIVRLQCDEGRVGYGEVAPIESFGSESFVTALGACASLEGEIEPESATNELLTYPATRFALQAAVAMIDAQDDYYAGFEKPWPVCGLVRDLADDSSWREAVEQGYRCLKVKIGVGDATSEKRAIDRLVEETSESVSLRLDANGALSRKTAIDWLEYLADVPVVEFLEQPLEKGEEDTMMRMMADFPTRLALDESVCHVNDLKRWRDQQWEGVFVLKPLLCGGYEELMEELRVGKMDVVFSSSLESKFGLANCLAIALQSRNDRRALGFDTEKLFADKNMGMALGPFLQGQLCPSIEELDTLWSQI
ncbi:o-succinylbenzoate synthase [Puniceicoccaceae bacterium K14]|nr:o-succinylbenzoate synthase [Puniceicoccaceae bacterium K14]